MIVGSLRKDSINKHLAEAMMELGAGEMIFEMADISTIPLYNGDLEGSFPQPVLDLKAKIKAADGIMIVTPEYNRSIPGVLKNMIDWTSRPYGDSAWNGKPVATAGTTGGNVGTALAQSHLREILLYLNTEILGQPEVYLSAYQDHFDQSGKITDPKTAEVLKSFLQKFNSHIAVLKS